MGGLELAAYKEVQRCWGALLIALVYEQYVPPEIAFKLWDTGKRKYSRDRPTLNGEIIELRKSGYKLKEIAEFTGLSLDAVFKRIKRFAPDMIDKYTGIQFSDEDKKHILDMHNQGRNNSQIGRLYNVDGMTIRARIKEWL